MPVLYCVAKWIAYASLFLLTFGLGLRASENAGYERSRQSENPEIDERVTPVHLHTTTVDDAITDVAFQDDSTVFGAGTSAGLQRSDDFGRTWSPVKVDSGGGLIRHVDFVDANTGWAMGDAVLVKTDDGGGTWTRSRFPIWLHDAEFDFVDRSVGYVAGSTGYCNARDSCTYGNAILKTTDGGKTWRKVYSDNTSLTVFQLIAIDKDIVFVLNGGSTVRRTIDGGVTWAMTYQNRNAAYQLAASPDGTVWLAGEQSLLSSRDKGLTWEWPRDLPANLFATEKWHAIEFAATGIGVVGSAGSCAGLTYDGGRSWTKYCSDKIRFGLMFDIEIRGDTALIASSSDTSSDSISRLRLTTRITDR